MDKRAGSLQGGQQPAMQYDAPAPANSAGCQVLIGDVLFHAAGAQSCYLSPRVGQSLSTSCVASPRRSPSPTLAGGLAQNLGNVHGGGSSGVLSVSPQKGSTYNSVLQQVETKLPPIQKTPRPLYNQMAFLHQAPPEPGIAAICRDTYTDMCTQRCETQWCTALWRRKQDVEGRQRSRQQAAAWRRACEERERRDTEKLKMKKLMEEQARILEEEEEQRRAEERKLRWKHVWDRVREKTNKEKPLVDAILSTSRYSRADQRVQMWRKVQLMKKRAQKKEQQVANRRHNFETLSLARRRIFEDVFRLYDIDNSGQLKASELYECLLELGFRGVDQRERTALLKICEETVAANASAVNKAQAEVDIYQFASEVVPSVCRALQKLRRSALVDQMSLIDTTEDGRLDFEQLLDIVKDLWPVEVNTDPNNSVQAELMTDLKSFLHRYVHEEVEFVQLCEHLGRVFEEVQWNNFAIQQKIREQRAVDEATFRDHRQEMVHMDRIFERIDIDHSGHLDNSECLRVYKELGLIPRKETEKKEVVALVEAYGNEIDFPCFLRVVSQIRAVLEKGTIKVLKVKNPAWEKDEASPVNTAQLSSIMVGAVGISLRSRKEQRVVSRVIREANADGDDLYTLKEVARICRQAQEFILKVKTQEELDVARDNGFTEEEVNQVRWAFDQLDSDESGSLDMKEVHKAICLLQADAVSDLSEEKFEIAFKRLDTDGSGSLEFPEFLRLLRLLQDREGVFAGDSSNLTTLAALGRSAMLQVLSVFGVGKEVESLNMQELGQRVSNALGIELNASLQAVKNVKTMQDLLTLAVSKRNSSSWS